MILLKINYFIIFFNFYILFAILSIPTFFVWRLLFKKVFASNRIRNIVSALTSLIITPIIYLIVIGSWALAIGHYPKKKFNQVEWIAKKEKRYQLAKNIIESKMLIGKTRNEVRNVLGIEDFKDSIIYEKYYLGFRPDVFDIEEDYLDIKFRSDTVVSVNQRDY